MNGRKHSYYGPGYSVVRRRDLGHYQSDPLAEADRREGERTYRIADRMNAESPKRRDPATRPEAVRCVLESGAAEAGHTLGELIGSVRPNKSRLDRQRYDLLAGMVRHLREHGVRQRVIAEALSRSGRRLSQQRVSDLEARGKELAEQEERKAAIRIPCRLHANRRQPYRPECPKCVERYPQDQVQNYYVACEGKLVAIGGDEPDGPWLIAVGGEEPEEPYLSDLAAEDAAREKEILDRLPWEEDAAVARMIATDVLADESGQLAD